MQRHELLISTDWLAANLFDDDVRIVDLRWSLDDQDWGERAYVGAHIPGAVYLHYLRDLSEPDDRVPGRIASPDRFRAVMEAAGIGDNTRVVAYDDNNIFMAARLVWSLHYYGHTNARILDGGIPKWLAEGRPAESGRVGRSRQQFTPRLNPAIRASKEDVLAISTRDCQLLDCRMDRTWFATGMHIPGAGRLPAPTVLREDGTWKPLEDLRQLVASTGGSPGKPVVLYCGGGVSASCCYVMFKMLGVENIAVYDGSWQEWGSDPNTPKEPH